MKRRDPFLAAAIVLAACSARAPAAAPEGDAGPVEDDAARALLGGDTTVFDASPNAYTYPARNLTSERRDLFALGDHFFNRSWVTAPASIAGNDGLGPTFNALSCSSCHTRDGRGSTDDLLVRLSVPGDGPHGAPLEEPSYGGQLNPKAIAGVPPEGRVEIDYEDVPGVHADGEPYVLRRPRYRIVDLGYGPLRPDVLTSPRVAPAMIGLGLLEAIPEATLVGLADPDDRDGDGVSGRVNRVFDVVAQAERVGRFGWKANQPTVLQQTAGAFLGDIGITSRLNPEESCPAAQAACRAAPSGGAPGAPELSDQKLDAVTSYARTVAVPARRDVGDPEVRRGEELFARAGCAKCHAPRLETGEMPGLPELSRQVIRPYTDLLLHDMGDELADGRPDFAAGPREWRTPPLWGIGLVAKVSKHDQLLHDGRARGVAEAILWHGGEAAAARDAFRAMPADARAALLRFLASL